MINRPERLDDFDVLSDCLEGTKWGSTIYNMAILEAANEPVRSAFIQMHHEELVLHRSIFEMMHQRGYYQVEPATTWSAVQPHTFNPAPAYQVMD